MRDHFEEHIKAALKKLSRKELGASRKGLVVRRKKPSTGCKARRTLKPSQAYRVGDFVRPY